MMMRIKFYIFVFLISTFSSAQVTFETKASKKKLGVNERLRVDFVMNKDGDNFEPPSFENFVVVGGPSQSINNSWLNGKHTFSKTYSYFLEPKERGSFTIGQASIEIDGEVYKTSPVKIIVTAAIDIPEDPNDPNYIATKNIHLVAEISNANPYLNEAISVTYKLFVSLDTGVENWREKDIPRYNDFWSQNIEIKGLKVENGTYKGEDYRYIVLRKTVLYPQKTGKLDLEPLTLSVSVQVPSNRTDFFGRRMMTTVERSIAAGKRTINVKPLPASGKPIDFSGAVGDFNFDVSASKNSLKATEALQVKVSVSGKGNLKLLDLPTLTLPSSLEVYEPEHKVNVTTKLTGMQGSISDSYTVVPSFQGKYPIPGISFSYFDPKTERYKTIASDEIIIDVTDGPINNDQTESVAETTPGKQPVLVSGNQFSSFKTKANFVSIEPQTFFKTKLFWASLLTPFLAIPIAILIRRRNETRQNDVIGKRLRRANKLAKKYLSAAKRTLGDKEAFYDALERSLHNYLKAKLNIETSDFSKEKITNLLNDKSVNEARINDFISLLKNCEIARYTPFSNVEMQQDYDLAVEVISSLDKQIR